MARKPASKKRSSVRVEHDLLGKKSIPTSAYYGVQTARAMENFAISGVPLSQYPDLIRALAMVKLAAARANHECDRKAMPARVLRGIDLACRDLIEGKLHDQFVVDMLQGGAGTSTNMNANEVIANRALELHGPRKGASTSTCTPTTT
jgi:aspartate ammonia-lyase